MTKQIIPVIEHALSTSNHLDTRLHISIKKNYRKFSQTIHNITQHKDVVDYFHFASAVLRNYLFARQL